MAPTNPITSPCRTRAPAATPSANPERWRYAVRYPLAWRTRTTRPPPCLPTGPIDHAVGGDPYRRAGRSAVVDAVVGSVLLEDRVEAASRRSPEVITRVGHRRTQEHLLQAACQSRVVVVVPLAVHEGRQLARAAVVGESEDAAQSIADVGRGRPARRALRRRSPRCRSRLKSRSHCSTSAIRKARPDSPPASSIAISSETVDAATNGCELDSTPDTHGTRPCQPVGGTGELQTAATTDRKMNSGHAVAVVVDGVRISRPQPAQVDQLGRYIDGRAAVGRRPCHGRVAPRPGSVPGRRS